MPNDLYKNRGGYRKLHSFTFATMIHLGTIQFCKRFVPFQEDPLGKTTGQMVGAARSGRQNIIEGSERAATSRETEIKLTDVARASLAELLGDYEIYLAEKGSIPWSASCPDRQQFGSLRLPEFEYTADTMHDYWQYYHEVKKPFLPWLESNDATEGFGSFRPDWVTSVISVTTSTYSGWDTPGERPGPFPRGRLPWGPRARC